MSRSAPASYHLDLYRYWLAKRGGRTMPSRSDIDPADIPALLPYIGIIEKADGEFRYRLIGSSMAKQLGFDATGAAVGSYVPAGQAVRTSVERVRAAACPAFNTAKYQFEPDIAHHSSVLQLPLSNDGMTVNLIIFLRLVRFHPYGWASRGWLRDAPLKVGEQIFFEDTAHLEKLVAGWETACTAAKLVSGG
jgi:hypothetical protein